MGQGGVCQRRNVGRHRHVQQNNCLNQGDRMEWWDLRQVRLVERLMPGVAIGVAQARLRFIHTRTVRHWRHAGICRHRRALGHTHAWANIGRHSQLREQQAEHGYDGGNEARCTGKFHGWADYICFYTAVISALGSQCTVRGIGITAVGRCVVLSKCGTSRRPNSRPAKAQQRLLP